MPLAINGGVHYLEVQDFLQLTPPKSNAQIDLLRRYKYPNSVKHQFALMRATTEQGAQFWIRIDRNRNTGDDSTRGISAISSFDVPAQDRVRVVV